VGSISVSEDEFELADTQGREHDPFDIEYAPRMESDDVELNESTTVTVVFRLQEATEPAVLTYTGLGTTWPFDERVRYIFR
jgi:hypothetical protein